MSSGTTHTRACLMLAGSFLSVGIWTRNFELMECGAGALVGVMISPDLDVDNGSIQNLYIRSVSGVFGEKIWNFVWGFYRKSMKHGSPLSHFPILSTLFRLIYLYCLFVLPLTFSHWRDTLNWWLNLIELHPEVLIGLMAADFIHWGLDILTVEHVERKWKKNNVQNAEKSSPPKNSGNKTSQKMG